LLYFLGAAKRALFKDIIWDAISRQIKKIAYDLKRSPVSPTAASMRLISHVTKIESYYFKLTYAL
jgi:hypothetical protein